MIKGIIKEFSECPLWDEKNTDCEFPLFQDGTRVRRLAEKQDIVFQDEWLDKFSYGVGGLWITFVDKIKIYERFIDVFQKGHQYPQENIVISERYWAGKRCIYDEKNENGDRFFTIHDYQTGKTVRSPNDEVYYYAIGQDFVYGGTSRGKVICYDMQAEVVWQSDFKRRTLGTNSPPPYIFEDSVIFNLGVDDIGKDHTDGRIVALFKETGEVKWIRKFAYFTPAFMIDGKIYLADQGRGIVLDAGTGVTQLEVETNILAQRIGDDDTFWFNGHYLCYCSYTESTLYLFDPISGELTQRLKTPHPYYLMPSEFPFTWHNKTYLTVGLDDVTIQGASYGLLILEESGDENPEISIFPRPEHYVLIVPEKDGEAYHIIINDDDLEKVVRYGEIISQSYVLVCGSHFMEDEKRQNKKFNGHIYISAPLEKLGTNAAQELEAMVAKIEKYCKVFDIYATTDNSPISVRVIPMPELTEELLQNTAPPLEILEYPPEERE